MLKQTKRKLPTRSLSLLLAAILVMGMILIPTGKTAAAETQVVVGNMNVPGSAKEYRTNAPDETKTYSFTMPGNGAMELIFKHASDEFVYVSISDSADNTIYASSYGKEVMITEGGHTFKELHYIYSELNKGQTYYLKISKYDGSYDTRFSLRYASNAATLTSGKAIYGGMKSNQISYYKVNVPQNGYLNVKISDLYKIGMSYEVQLLNAKKKPVTHSYDQFSTDDAHSTTFGVKKGTYYLAVHNYASYSVLYKIKATTKAVTTKAGSKKSKAVTLKRNKVKKGIIYAKNNKKKVKHWYKIYLPKRKKVKLYIDTKASGGGGGSGAMWVRIMPANRYNSIDTSSTYMNLFRYYSTQKDVFQPYSYGNKDKTLNPGIYYVCVYSDGYGNGYYSLKWK